MLADGMRRNFVEPPTVAHSSRHSARAFAHEGNLHIS